MITLTKENWEKICKVNTDVNNSTEYRTDIELYNKTEHWEPSNGLYGDCEDIGLEKRKRLLELGFDINDLRLATCWVEGPNKEPGSGGYHAVLIVHTDKGDYCLDNRAWDPVIWTKFPYKWHKILVGNNEWRLIGK